MSAPRWFSFSFALFATLTLCISSVAEDAVSTQAYEDLLEHRLGFAERVTGGSGGEVVVLDTLDFSRFRKALDGDSPRWIRFKSGLKGKIELDGHLYIGSNKTIDGRGAEITITSPDDCDEIRFWKKDANWNDIDQRRNLIVHNIKIVKVGKGDNCGQGLGIAFGAKDVWVDHVTFSGNGDESLSMGKGSTNLTVSWCRFIDTDKAILLSWGDEADGLLDRNMHATIHHCYFLRVNGRSPVLLWGKSHCFNNLLKQWNWCGICVAMEGQLYSENNIYGDGRWNNSPPVFDTSTNKWRSKPGFIRSKGDRFLSTKGIDGKGPGINKGKVFDPGKYYRYRHAIDDNNDELIHRLEKQTGWSADPQWK